MSKVIKVTYDAESFCNAQFGECIPYARRYVEENPKEEYSTDDFMEVYRMKEREEGWKGSQGGPKCWPIVNYGHKDDNTLDRLVDILEGD